MAALLRRLAVLAMAGAAWVAGYAILFAVTHLIRLALR